MPPVRGIATLTAACYLGPPTQGELPGYIAPYLVRGALVVGLGNEAEGFRVSPAVVLGQHSAGLTGPVGDGSLADLAACDWEAGNRHGESPRC